MDVQLDGNRGVSLALRHGLADHGHERCTYYSNTEVCLEMKIKRMVKRLFAVASGATMLGATAMGALAADLGTYPDFFVTDGAYNGFFVVG